MSEIISIAQPANTKMTSEAWWNRFTSAELVAFEVACQHNPADTLVNQQRAAKLRIYRRDIDHDGYFDVTATKRINKTTGLLVTEGILSAANAAAYLANPITADEAYQG